MTQYNTIKAKYPDALLLFRVGDFYENIPDSGIVLTKKSQWRGAYRAGGLSAKAQMRWGTTKEQNLIKLRACLKIKLLKFT